MKTWNAWIYHCECCGRVVHQDSDRAAPNCCERPMTCAAAETLYGSEDDAEIIPRDDASRVQGLPRHPK